MSIGGRSVSAATTFTRLSEHPSTSAAIRTAIALHAQPVDGDTRRLEQIATSNLRGINAQLRADLIELRFEGEAHVHGAMSTHGAAGRLVGQHAITVVLDVGNVVQGA